jgi:ATP-binding cassette subfamily B protein
MNRIDWLSKHTIDAIFDDVGQEGATRIVLLVFLAAGLAFVFRVASRWLIFNAGRDVEYELRGAFLDHLHRLGAAFYRKVSSGDVMSRATNDLLQVRLLFGFGVLNLGNAALAFVSALQVLLHIHVRLTLVSLVMVPVIVLVTRTFSKNMFSATRDNQQALAELTDRLQTNLSGVRVIRSFALEGYEETRFAQTNERYLKASLRLARMRGLFGPVAGAASAVSTLAFFWYGATLLAREVSLGGITRGDFFAFWLALGRMTWPIIALGFSVSIVQRGRAGLLRLQDVFDARPEVEDGPLPAPATIEGGITVRGLSFTFHEAKRERHVLEDVSFQVGAGKSLAIMGRTGSGKSTLAALLARLLPTPSNTVFLDGADVCALPVPVVRGAIGYAQQDAFLFSTSVAENIAFSLPPLEAGPQRAAAVEAAAREAAIADELARLPEGFDTVVGERGVQLSGGQKQRVALARALAREPKILVLDDPLSAVDAKTEAQILDAIERQKAARTLVLITHRVAAARRCDEILVLDQGRVVERGKHETLVANGGVYATFAAEQEAAAELSGLEAELSEGAHGEPS